MTVRNISVSFVLRLDDITTGRPIWPDDQSLRVCSPDGLCVPLAKNDGYFVFTGPRPDTLRVTSSIYEGFTLPVIGVDFLRAAMVPKEPPEGRLYPLDATDGVHIGFCGERGGYALASAIEAGAREVLLHKEDYADLAGLVHILIAPGGMEEAVFVRSGFGNGRYSLCEPVSQAFPLRSRLLPLMYVIGGNLKIPVPGGAKYAYILRKNTPERITL